MVDVLIGTSPGPHLFLAGSLRGSASLVRRLRRRRADHVLAEVLALHSEHATVHWAGGGVDDADERERARVDAPVDVLVDETDQVRLSVGRNALGKGAVLRVHALGTLV